MDAERSDNVDRPDGRLSHPDARLSRPDAVLF
jgi:hypothetical protein